MHRSASALSSFVVLLAAFASSGCRSSRPRWHYGPQVEAPTAAVHGDEGPTFDPVRVEHLLSDQGCTACHTFHGETLVGPALGGSFGMTRRLADGTQAVVDHAYLVRSLYEPGAQVVEGYPNVMPTYEGAIDEASADEIANYLAALR